MVPSFLDLTYFFEVAVASNLSHAAKKIGISQPSLSIAINRLEKILSTDLLIRHSHGVTLTKSGERLFKHVAELVEKWKKTELYIQTLEEEVSGKVIIGYPLMVGDDEIEVVATLLRTYPELEIQFLHQGAETINQSVIDGRCDIGIIFDPIRHPDLIIKKVMDSDMTFWRSNSVEVDCSVVICDPSRKITQQLLKEYEKNHHITRVCHSDNAIHIAQLVKKGLGIGILPSCLVEHDFRDQFTRIESAPCYHGEVGLIYRSENKTMLAREIVIKAIKNLFS